MTLAPVDLLAGVVTAQPAGLGRLDALAVDDRARGAGFTSDPLAIRHDELVVDCLKAPIVAERRKPAIDRSPGWEVGAGLSRAVQVDAVQSPATPRPSDRFGNAVPCAYAALEWSGSTWRIQVGLSNLPRITSAAATQHLSKRPLRTRPEHCHIKQVEAVFGSNPTRLGHWNRAAWL